MLVFLEAQEIADTPGNDSRGNGSVSLEERGCSLWYFGMQHQRGDILKVGGSVSEVDVLQGWQVLQGDGTGVLGTARPHWTPRAKVLGTGGSSSLTSRSTSSAL